MKLTGSFAAALRIGLASARANLVPIVILWGLGVAAVAAYYWIADFRAALDPVFRWRTEYGWKVVFPMRAFFCGVLPGIFLLSMGSLRPRHPILTLIAQVVWCGAWGVLCDWFYAVQDLLFGAGYGVGTIVQKTLVDQFPWTVLVVAPPNAVFYFWLGRDMSLARCRREWPKGGFLAEILFQNLVCNWIVWIPLTLAVFCFPQPLRVWVSGIASAFWFLMSLQIGARVCKEKGGEIAP